MRPLNPTVRFVVCFLFALGLAFIATQRHGVPRIPGAPSEIAAIVFVLPVMMAAALLFLVMNVAVSSRLAADAAERRDGDDRTMYRMFALVTVPRVSADQEEARRAFLAKWAPKYGASGGCEARAEEQVTNQRGLSD